MSWAVNTCLIDPARQPLSVARFAFVTTAQSVRLGLSGLPSPSIKGLRGALFVPRAVTGRARRYWRAHLAR